MKDIKRIYSTHIMITADNAIEGMKVLVNDNGGDFDFQAGTIINIEKTPKSWVFITVETASGTCRKKVRSLAYYAENVFSIGEPVPYLNGDQSDIYLV